MNKQLEKELTQLVNYYTPKENREALKAGILRLIEKHGEKSKN
jgi:hypothetical protein